MISVILYGRNDSHGYNLHRRAAISINAIAEVLDCEDDEILFVDYNSPDDFPTFPEAISDTLTIKAKKLIKIFRVRPDVHKELFSEKTKLVAIEPVARNVALRRSNPKNTWILSTNTDMIFVPKNKKSLSDNVRDLSIGYYVAPRFELPETMWESFDRKEPLQNIKRVSELAKKMHIEEITYSDLNLYDAPGDFQLMPRSDLFALRGFDERMIWGWHVDSNIGKRMELHFGNISDGAIIADCYHCDHTRQITAAHKSNSKTNNWRHFVTNIRNTILTDQADDWGLAQTEIEQISLSKVIGNDFCETVSGALKKPQTEYYFSTDLATSEHMLPYLYDLFHFVDRNIKIVWLGFVDETLDYFKSCLADAKFRTELLIFDCENPFQINDLTQELISAHSVIINFGTKQGKANEFRQVFFSVIQSFAEKMDDVSDTYQSPRFVTVNAHEDNFCGKLLSSVMSDFLVTARSPLNTKVKSGRYNSNFGQNDQEKKFSIYDNSSADKQKTKELFEKSFQTNINQLSNFVIWSTEESIPRQGFLLRMDNLILRKGEYSISLKIQGSSELFQEGFDVFLLVTSDNTLHSKFNGNVKKGIETIELKFPVSINQLSIISCNLVCDYNGDMTVLGFNLIK